MKKKGLTIAAMAVMSIGLAFGACNKREKVSSDEGNSSLVSENEAGDSMNADELIIEEEQIPAAEADASGYVTTPSGLKYKVIKEGSGEHPSPYSTVTVNYTGKLEDGTVFDSTDQHGQPISFPLNRVIPGWTEGLQLMQPGAIYEFVIPSNLAYGPQGVPGAIPPNATLIFDVELLGIQ